MIEFMTPYEVMEKLVENIEKQRIRKNMTQSDLYKKAGLSASGYGKFIKNKSTSFENILKLLFARNFTYQTSYSKNYQSIYKSR
jgi:transcriptional regulator with XRE-family HTH domain